MSTPLDDGYTQEPGYWLCYPEAKAHLPPLEVFCGWLLSQYGQPPPTPGG
ncbi:hypothetical protein PY257_05170 [Ramlibacter sp. H39-3-26]|nr:hypothetical protein [Ramlibacter sp. H39-3-26]MDF1484578.1 hypothetical protein [Ramlibacter sp. H39-3-26]